MGICSVHCPPTVAVSGGAVAVGVVAVGGVAVYAEYGIWPYVLAGAGIITGLVIRTVRQVRYDRRQHAAAPAPVDYLAAPVTVTVLHPPIEAAGQLAIECCRCGQLTADRALAIGGTVGDVCEPCQTDIIGRLARGELRAPAASVTA